jgi:transglutaminase-like putative cysteine protease
LFYFLVIDFTLDINNVFAFNDDEINYSIKNIPDGLRNDAGAVIRYYSVKFEIADNNSAFENVRIAVTIFNKSEQHNGELNLGYDKFHRITELEGTIYNEYGEEIRSLKKNEIEDYSDFDGYSLYSDNRVKFAQLYHDRFPYTVEFVYEYTYKGYLNWPTWYSRGSTYPVQHSIFEVITPPGYNLRFWTNRDTLKPELSSIKSKQLYKWKLKNQPRLPEASLDEDIEDYASIVRIAPSDFELENYKGNMNSWKEFGTWFYNLSRGKQSLPQETIQEINQLIKNVSDSKEKIEILYRYLQSHTRYVSVQLGIGGWQPYDATSVHTKGYGDCKALSNYMVSLLDLAGVEAFPVLIRNGHHRYPLIPEFPSNQFNHMIACVPSETDTVWLECTSSALPAGSVGWSNENRKALMITKDGGMIVNTPRSTSAENLQLNKIDVKIISFGKADVNSVVRWFGNQHLFALPVINYSSQEQEKWIRDMLEVPDITLNSYTFGRQNTDLNEVSLSLAISIPRYCSVSGKRIFFNPNVLERRTRIPKVFSERMSPVRLRYPYTDIDSVEFIIPKNYKVETIPGEVSIETPFARFYCKTTDDGNKKISHVRILELKDYFIPSENYPAYQSFLAEVAKADKSQVVIIQE